MGEGEGGRGSEGRRRLWICPGGTEPCQGPVPALWRPCCCLEEGLLGAVAWAWLVDWKSGWQRGASRVTLRPRGFGLSTREVEPKRENLWREWVSGPAGFCCGPCGV